MDANVVSAINQVVQKLDRAIHWINIYPWISIRETNILHYPLDRDLSSWQCYLPFQPLGTV